MTFDRKGFEHDPTREGSEHTSFKVAVRKRAPGVGHTGRGTILQEDQFLSRDFDCVQLLKISNNPYERQS